MDCHAPGRAEPGVALDQCSARSPFPAGGAGATGLLVHLSGKSRMLAPPSRKARLHCPPPPPAAPVRVDGAPTLLAATLNQCSANQGSLAILPG